VADYPSQPGGLFQIMTAAQQQVLGVSTTRAQGHAPGAMAPRHVGHRGRTDAAGEVGMAKASGVLLTESAA
jgi:catalase